MKKKTRLEQGFTNKKDAKAYVKGEVNRVFAEYGIKAIPSLVDKAFNKISKNKSSKIYSKTKLHNYVMKNLIKEHSAILREHHIPQSKIVRDLSWAGELRHDTNTVIKKLKRDDLWNEYSESKFKLLRKMFNKLSKEFLINPSVKENFNKFVRFENIDKVGVNTTGLTFLNNLVKGKDNVSIHQIPLENIENLVKNLPKVIKHIKKNPLTEVVQAEMTFLDHKEFKPQKHLYTVKNVYDALGDFIFDNYGIYIEFNDYSEGSLVVRTINVNYEVLNAYIKELGGEHIISEIERFVYSTYTSQGKRPWKAAELLSSNKSSTIIDQKQFSDLIDYIKAYAIGLKRR